MKCIVKDCRNHSDEGKFVGEVFCHVYYLDGSKATYSKG
jgi:hypothetical protein